MHGLARLASDTAAAAFAEALAPVRAAVARAEAADDDDERLHHLKALFGDGDWLAALSQAALGCLCVDARHLFGLTAIGNGGLRQLILASGARVSVTLCTLDPDHAPGKPDRKPAIAGFSGSHSLFRLLSTDPVGARFACLSRRSGACRERAIRIAPGAVLALDEAWRTVALDPPAQQVLFLRARVRRVPAPLVRTFAPGEATPRMVANGDDGLARALAMIAVLRSLDVQPPVDALRALMPRAHGTHRWTLMRAMLGADTQAAWPDLVAMARDEPDLVVRNAARRLLSRAALSPAASAEA